MSDLDRFIKGVKTLNIPRIEDLPYATSPPIQFVYQSTANLTVGTYTWADEPSALTPNRPIQANALYFFRSITLAADVAELDYTTNLVTTPEFYGFLQSDARAVLFREPVQMVKFFDQFDYRLTWRSQSNTDQLFGAFRGLIVQGPALIGKTSITLTAVISAQEVVEEGFINLFYQKYPESVRG